MSPIKLNLLAVAVVIGIPVAAAVAAQQFGRDSVYVEPAHAVRGAAVIVEIKRFGRDSVYVTQDTVLTRPSPLRVTGAISKPGRA